MRRAPKKLIEKWEARLQRDGLPTDASLRRWTFPGGRDEPDGSNSHQAHRSLDAIGGALHEMQEFLGASEDGNAVRLQDLPGAQFWRLAGHRANNLPPRHPHRPFLIAVADSGNLRGTAAKHLLTKRKGERVWRKFLLDVCQLPPPKTTIEKPRKSRKSRKYISVTVAAEPEIDPFEVPGPGRSLSKQEIANLHYLPPSKETDK